MFPSYDYLTFLFQSSDVNWYNCWDQDTSQRCWKQQTGFDWSWFCFNLLLTKIRTRLEYEALGLCVSWPNENLALWLNSGSSKLNTS